MPLISVQPIATLPPGSLAQIQINGNAYALCHHDGAVRCFDGLCPHAGGPLGDGNLDGDQIVCPWHAWAFNCKTGINDFDAGIQLNSYPVVVKDGSIYVDLP
jgi:nitrite reductase/ring-hydroxylating ferredoxin subunit